MSKCPFLDDSKQDGLGIHVAENTMAGSFGEMRKVFKIVHVSGSRRYEWA